MEFLSSIWNVLAQMAPWLMAFHLLKGSLRKFRKGHCCCHGGGTGK